jgi:anthranilate phosphoribosyltransferase
VLIPSYNGARKLANLTPLLALLLAREGVPVLIHGVQQDPGRVTTAEILAELGIGPTGSTAGMLDAFADRRPCFMPVETLAPKLARQLALRRILGVRNSTHTLVKILQPFDGPALRLVSYTHPEYLAMLTGYFRSAAPAVRGDAFLMRGTEGETVANANRAQQIDWFHAGEQTLLAERDAPTDELAPAPEGRDAAATADWILRALRGEQPVPPPIAAQVAHCRRIAAALRTGTPQ